MRAEPEFRKIQSVVGPSLCFEVVENVFRLSLEQPEPHQGASLAGFDLDAIGKFRERMRNSRKPLEGVSSVERVSDRLRIAAVNGNIFLQKRRAADVDDPQWIVEPATRVTLAHVNVEFLSHRTADDHVIV